MSENSHDLPGPAPEPPPGHGPSLFLAYLLAAAFTHFIGLTTTHCDFSAWVMVARQWEAGATLYGGIYDNKSPVVFLFVRLIDLGWPQLGFYLAEIFLTALAASSLARALRSWKQEPAWLPGFLLIAWSGGATPTNITGQQIESIASTFDTLGLTLALQALAGGSRSLSWLSGACYMLMIGFRIPCALTGVALVPALIFRLRTHGASPVRRTVAWMVAGALVVALALAIHGLIYQYLALFCNVVLLDFQYGSLGRSEEFGHAALILVSLLLTFWKQQLAAVMTAMSGAILVRRWREIDGEARTIILTALVWFVGATASAVPGGRHYGHYYHVLWPSIALIASSWAFVLPPSMARFRLRLAAFLSLLAVGTSMFQAHHLWSEYRARGGAQELPEQKIWKVVDFVHSKAPAGAPVALCVWGNEWAELLWRIERPPLTRLGFPNSWVLTDGHDFLLTEWIDAFVAHPPPVVVTDGTFISGPGEAPRHDVRRSDLAKVVHEEYRETFRLGTVRVLERQSR